MHISRHSKMTQQKNGWRCATIIVYGYSVWRYYTRRNLLSPLEHCFTGDMTPCSDAVSFVAFTSARFFAAMFWKCLDYWKLIMGISGHMQKPSREVARNLRTMIFFFFYLIPIRRRNNDINSGSVQEYNCKLTCIIFSQKFQWYDSPVYGSWLSSIDFISQKSC